MKRIKSFEIFKKSGKKLKELGDSFKELSKEELDEFLNDWGPSPKEAKKLAKRLEDKVNKETHGLGTWEWGIKNKEPNIGKFVILKDYPFPTDDIKPSIIDKLNLFIQNNIGQILYAGKSGTGISYLIKYRNVPRDLEDYFDWKNTNPHLISFMENIDFIGTYNDCQTFIKAEKYNL